MQRHEPLTLIAALLAMLLVLSGCDGGISGTGVPTIEAEGTQPPASRPDGAVTAPPADSDGESDGESGGEAAGEVDAAPGDAAPTDAAGEQPNSPPALDATPRQLENARQVRTGPPGVRVINASREPLSVTAGPDETVLVPRLETSGEVLNVIELSEAVQAPLRILSGVTDQPYAVFDPLALVDGSVTTLLARPRTGGQASVVTANTAVASADPALALVRIATAVVGEEPVGTDDGARGDTFQASLRNGDGERSLGTVDPARPFGDYLSVPPGEYRVDIAGGANELDGLTLRAGDVVTAVLVSTPSPGSTPRLLVLLDGEAAR